MLKEVRFSIAALFCAAILSLVCGVASWSSARADSTSGKKDLASRQWAIVRVALPENDEPFPPGIGADIAGSQMPDLSLGRNGLDSAPSQERRVARRDNENAFCLRSADT